MILRCLRIWFFSKKKTLTLIHGWEWVHVLQLPSLMFVNEDHQLPKMRNVIHPIDHRQPTEWWHIPTGRSNGGKCTGAFGLILFWDANSETNFMKIRLKSWLKKEFVWMHPFLGGEDDPIGFFPSIGWRYRCYLDDFETGRMCACAHIQEMIGLYTPKSVVVHCEYGGLSCIHPGIVGKQADHGFGFHSFSAAFSTSADAETMIKADKVHLWR